MEIKGRISFFAHTGYCARSSFLETSCNSFIQITKLNPLLRLKLINEISCTLIQKLQMLNCLLSVQLNNNYPSFPNKAPSHLLKTLKVIVRDRVVRIASQLTPIFQTAFPRSFLRLSSLFILSMATTARNKPRVPGTFPAQSTAQKNGKPTAIEPVAQSRTTNGVVQPNGTACNLFSLACNRVFS